MFSSSPTVSRLPNWLGQSKDDSPISSGSRDSFHLVDMAATQSDLTRATQEITQKVDNEIQKFRETIAATDEKLRKLNIFQEASNKELVNLRKRVQKLEDQQLDMINRLTGIEEIISPMHYQPQVDAQAYASVPQNSCFYVVPPPPPPFFYPSPVHGNPAAYPVQEQFPSGYH